MNSKYDDFDSVVKSEAATMAEAINGGRWNKDYTEAQKIGWCLKVEWAMQRYCEMYASEVIVMYGDNNHSLSVLPKGLHARFPDAEKKN